MTIPTDPDRAGITSAVVRGLKEAARAQLDRLQRDLTDTRTDGDAVSAAIGAVTHRLDVLRDVELAVRSVMSSPGLVCARTPRGRGPTPADLAAVTEFAAFLHAEAAERREACPSCRARAVVLHAYGPACADCGYPRADARGGLATHHYDTERHVHRTPPTQADPAGTVVRDLTHSHPLELGGPVVTHRHDHSGANVTRGGR